MLLFLVDVISTYNEILIVCLCVCVYFILSVFVLMAKLSDINKWMDGWMDG